MDIIVQGTGIKNYTPNEITLSFDFKTVDSTYEKALELGVKNVETYIELLLSLGFKKEDFKTRSFRVAEEKHYDESTRTYVFDGYAYTQNAKLKFDYDMKKLSTLMELTSKEKNPPIYRINFNIKDDKSIEEEMLSLAYKNAEFQAQAIAKASGVKIVGCKKISFEPFTPDSYSPSIYNDSIMSKSKCCSASTRESIMNVFVPEDVVLDKTIFCQFIAE